MDVIISRAEAGDAFRQDVQAAGAEIDDADASGPAVELGDKLCQAVGAKVGSGACKIERCIRAGSYADVRDAPVGLQHDGGSHAVVSILECPHLHCAGVFLNKLAAAVVAVDLHGYDRKGIQTDEADVVLAEVSRIRAAKKTILFGNARSRRGLGLRFPVALRLRLRLLPASAEHERQDGENGGEAFTVCPQGFQCVSVPFSLYVGPVP